MTPALRLKIHQLNLRTSEIREAQEKHISDKELARTIKDGVKYLATKDKETSGVAFDLEKVLLCPQGPTSAFYYSRRLMNHNLTMTDINTMETSCYIGTRSKLRRRSCEIATCCRMFLATKRNEGCTPYVFPIGVADKILTEWC